MVKIRYQNSSIECSTVEEAERVLRVLNEIRKERAAEAGLKIKVDVSSKVKRFDAAKPTKPN